MANECPLTSKLVYDTSLPFLQETAVSLELEWYTIDNSYANSYSIAVEAQRPDDSVAASASYLLQVDASCDFRTVVVPTLTNQVYKVGDPAASYEVPEF